METNTCCFIGHRTINETQALRAKLTGIVEKLITENTVDTFLFGSKSRFNDLCYELVTELKGKYSHIKRVYVRAEFPDISLSYEEYLLQRYEQTYYPEKVIEAGRAAYVERNREMIEKSKFCVIYYEEGKIPVTRKSGAETALQYAIKRRKAIIKLP